MSECLGDQSDWSGGNGALKGVVGVKGEQGVIILQEIQYYYIIIIIYLWLGYSPLQLTAISNYFESRQTDLK